MLNSDGRRAQHETTDERQELLISQTTQGELKAILASIPTPAGIGYHGRTELFIVTQSLRSHRTCRKIIAASCYNSRQLNENTPHNLGIKSTSELDQDVEWLTTSIIRSGREARFPTFLPGAQSSHMHPGRTHEAPGRAWSGNCKASHHHLGCFSLSRG